MTEIHIQNSRIDFGETIREFDYEIKSVKRTNGLLVVLFGVPPQVTNNRNVICFDKTGVEKWRIEALPSDRENKPYMSIDISQGRLIADNWIGVQAAVDIQTGKIISTSLSK